MASVQPRSFADLLRRYRVAAGLTQEELAERAGLSRRAIGALETGARRAPRKDTVSLLAKALALSSAEQALLASTARQHPPSGGSRTGPPGNRAEPSPNTMSRPRQPGIPLVGRQRELAALGRHLAGEGPPVLLVAGEPGIGKSRLLHEAEEHARAQGWMVLAGGCHLRSRQEPYAPFAELLARFLAGRPPARKRVDLHGCRWLVRLLPELADSSVVPAPTWTLSPEHERRLLFAAVTQFCANVAGAAGTLLLLDDLHWAGEDALELLAALVREPGSQPLRVVAAYRDTEVRPHDPLGMLIANLARAEAVTPPIVLPPLAHDEATELLARLLAEVPEIAQDAAEDLRHVVAPRASGMPLYLISFAQDIRMNPLVAGMPDHVPWSAAESIRQRIARLSPAAREALAIAATAGRQVARTVLLRVMWALNYDESETLRALEEAARARLLIEAPEDLAVFAHDLIQETLVVDMSRARQAVLHRRVAVAQETLPLMERRATELAWHFAESDEPARALPYALQAGDQAEVIYAHTEAEGHYQMALRLARRASDKAREAEVLERYADVLYRLARYSEACASHEHAATIYRELGDWEGLAWATTQMAKSGDQIGKTALSLVWLEALLSTLATEAGGAEASADIVVMDDASADRSPQVGMLQGLAVRAASILTPRTAARLYLCLTSRLVFLGHHQAVHAASECTIAHARAAGDQRIESLAYSFRAAALRARGQFSAATAALETARELALACGDLEALYLALLTLSDLYERQAESQRGRDVLLQTLDAVQQLGDVGDISEALCRLAGFLVTSGEWAAAREYFGRAMQTSGWAGGVGARSARLGIAILESLQGQPSQEITPVEEILAPDELTGAWRMWLLAAQTLAERDLLAGNAQAASERLQQATHQDIPDRPQPAAPMALLAWAALERGDTRQATALVKQAHDRAEAQHDRLVAVDILRVEALIAIRQRRWEPAHVALEAALARCRAMPYPYAMAKALYVYGQLHTAMGEPGRARERYTEALAICRRLGERPYAEQLERALDALPG